MYAYFKAPLSPQSNITEIWLEELFRIELYHFLDGFQEVCFQMNERRRHGLNDFRKGNHDVKSMQCTFQHSEKHFTCRRFAFFEGLSCIILY